MVRPAYSIGVAVASEGAQSLDVMYSCFLVKNCWCQPLFPCSGKENAQLLQCLLRSFLPRPNLRDVLSQKAQLGRGSKHPEKEWGARVVIDDRINMGGYPPRYRK